jgi:hypothetical protein
MTSWIALDCADEPSAVIWPAGQTSAPAPPEVAEEAAELPVVAVVVLEQAARARVLRAATAAIFDKRVILKSSFSWRTGGGSSPPAPHDRQLT